MNFPPIGSARALITSGSEPVSTANADGALTSTFSVSTETANTNVSTSNTAPTTSQVATENCLALMEKSIASLGDTLILIQGQKRQKVVVRPVGKDIVAGAGTGIIICITEDLVLDHHKHSIKAVGIIMVTSMAVDFPPQISHLMPHNQTLMTNMRNAPNIAMKMRRKSNSRMMVTMKMWVTCSLRTSKQLCLCLLQ